MATVGQLIIEEYKTVLAQEGVSARNSRRVSEVKTGEGGYGLPVPGTPLAITSYDIDDTTPNAAVTFDTTATYFIVTAQAACWIKQAASPTAAIDTDDNRYLPADLPRSFMVEAAKLSGLGDS